ncbi:MAG TPA: ABC transporter substrate-binding protein [Alphaproteobacteria bacterium]|jgi:TRAP-type C4-dicarboxylate transport system substrate-binding protein
MHKLVTLAAIAAVVFATPARAEEAKLKAASFLPLTQSFGVHFKRWVDEVNKRGKGLLQIDAVGPEAIPVPEQPNAVKSGVIQMHYGPPTFYTGTMWEGEALSLSETTIKALRANGAWAYLDKLHREKMNSVLLAGLGDGVKFFVYTTAPAKADDKDKPMSGLTLRSVPLYRVFFESLGARAVSLPPGEVFTALERKVVQGYGWPRWGIKDMGWLPVTKYRYGPGFFNVNVNVLVNLDAWNKLTGPQRKLLEEMALWLDEEWPKWRAAQDADEDKIQKDAGVQYVDLGAWFSKRAHDAYWADLEKKSPQHIPHLRKLVTKQ